MLILKGGRVIPMEGPEYVGDIAIENGRIAAMEKNCECVGQRFVILRDARSSPG